MSYLAKWEALKALHLASSKVAQWLLSDEGEEAEKIQKIRALLDIAIFVYETTGEA